MIWKMILNNSSQFIKANAHDCLSISLYIFFNIRLDSNI